MPTYNLWSPACGRFDAARFQSTFANDNRVGLDTEYTGNGIYAPGARLRLVQFGTETDGVALDMRDDVQRRAAINLLRDERRLFVVHGAVAAEVPAVATHLGVDISDRVYDTYVVAQLCYPGEMNAHGLKDFAAELGDAGLALLDAQQEVDDEFKRLWLLTHKNGRREDIQSFGWTHIDSRHPAYLRYGALDAICVRRLAPLLADRAREFDVHRVIPFEQRVNASAARMSLRGWQTDRTRSAELLATIGADNAEAMSEFQATYGIKARSPRRWEPAAEQGVEFTVFTPTGQPKLSKEVLRELHATHPDSHAVSTLLRAAETANVTLFLTMLNHLVDGTGRVHPGINTLGAVTGRWRVRGGIQTASASSGARSVFVPSDPEHVLVSIDMGQIEPRVAFELSECHDLIELCRQGVDPYAAAATTVFGPEYTARHRKVAKRIVLGSLFGAGLDTLFRQARYTDGILDISRDEIERARAAFNASVPRIKRTAKWLEKQADIRLPSGRFAPHDPDRLYRAINSYTQGPARDFLMETLLLVEDAGLGRYVNMALHDELLFDLPRELLDTAIPTIQAIFERGYGRVPTTCDVEIMEHAWMGKGVLWVDWKASQGVR